MQFPTRYTHRGHRPRADPACHPVQLSRCPSAPSSFYPPSSQVSLRRRRDGSGRRASSTGPRRAWTLVQTALLCRRSPIEATKPGSLAFWKLQEQATEARGFCVLPVAAKGKVRLIWLCSWHALHTSTLVYSSTNMYHPDTRRLFSPGLLRELTLPKDRPPAIQKPCQHSVQGPERMSTHK